MRNSIPAIIILAVVCCLLCTQTAQAQNTLAYATVDYDPETNIIYGYAYTETDYSASVYYNKTHVTAKLRDASDTQLAIGTVENYNARAELYLQALGNGNPPYKIQSGHMVFPAYYVTNFYDYYTRMYRSGWLDYYYYTYYAEGPGGPVINVPISFTFGGRRPETVTTSPNRFLGQLLSLWLPQSPVTFTRATLGNTSDDFDSIMGNQIAELDATQSGFSICGHALAGFWFTVDFTLPEDTREVLGPPFSTARGFGGTNDADFKVTRTELKNINLSSTPKTGQMDIEALIRTSGETKPPYNAIKVTIAGKYGNSETFEGKGTVRISCPQPPE